jgi:hypothetical protein
VHPDDQHKRGGDAGGALETVYELVAMLFDGVATDPVDWKFWDMTTYQRVLVAN